MFVLSTGVLRNMTLVILILSALTVLLLMYHKSPTLLKCHPSPVKSTETEKSGNSSATTRRKKPVLLVWFWPENKKFDLQDCKTLLGIGDCQLSDDKSLASKADGVLIYHKAISQDLSNLPTSRTRAQRWIWFNPDPPLVSQKIPGIQALFNLTMTYRKDADIQVRWKVSARKTPENGFTPPPKRRLVCWVVDSKEMTTTFNQTYKAYMDLLKHIAVDLIDKMEGEGYQSTIKSCKFYLSFESSIHKDYITEKFTTPLGLGTVPVALGPPRINYESFVPGSSFIHVNDFADSAALAAHLQSLDQDEEAYLRYFDWRKFYTIGTPFADEKYRFLHPICQACQHLSMSRVFRYVPDLYKWFLVTV